MERTCRSVLMTFKKQSSKYISFHLLFFLGLMLLFFMFFMLNILILSLTNINLNDLSLSPILEELFVCYTQIKHWLLTILTIALLFFFVYQQRLNQQEIQQTLQQSPKRAIVFHRIFNNIFLFSIALLTIFLTFLLFPMIYQTIIIKIHSSIASQSEMITELLENTLVEASSNHIVIRFTTMEQIFEHLFYFSPEKWTRIFVKSFLHSTIVFSFLMISLNSLITTSHLIWLTKRKKPRP